jgi:polysaccharide deacetylase 2 family uncharacterized protein YibQ
MRIKIFGVIFTLAVLFLTVLLGLKNGISIPLFEKIRSTIHFPSKNNTTHSAAPRANSLKIETMLIERFEKLETPRKELSIIHSLEDSTILIEAPIPRGKPVEWVIWYLTNAVGQTGYRVADCLCNDNPVGCTIRLRSNRPGNPGVRIVLTQANRYFSDAAKMAIVIADFGFSATATTVDFLSFPEPLTVSLVSSKKMSTWTAQIANEYHKEIVILLPMEPLARTYRHYAENTLMIHYPAEKLRSMLRSAAAAVPSHAGFSNLCGSRVLDDSQVMGTLMAELKKENSYFLIDPVARKTTAIAAARSQGVPFAVVDLSLDSAGSSGEFLPDTLRHAAMIAQKTGTVIVQARATAAFIATLRSQLPYLQHNGIRLVYLSEIVKRTETAQKGGN